jgi:hypothetical protein
MAGLARIVATAGFTAVFAASAWAGNINTAGGLVDVLAPVGSPQVATAGQTFTPDATQTNLHSFSLYLRRPAPYGDLTGNPMTFRGYLAEWDAANEVVGSILFTSGNTVMPANGTPTEFAFPLALTLTPGNTYVAFLTILDLPAQPDSAFGMPFTDNVLAGGQAVFSYSETFGALATEAWITGDLADYDMFFKAIFRDPQAVPGPAALGVFGMGLLGLGALLRHRRAA